MRSPSTPSTKPTDVTEANVEAPGKGAEYLLDLHNELHRNAMNQHRTIHEELMKQHEELHQRNIQREEQQYQETDSTQDLPQDFPHIPAFSDAVGTTQYVTRQRNTWTRKLGNAFLVSYLLSWAYLILILATVLVASTTAYGIRHSRPSDAELSHEIA